MFKFFTVDKAKTSPHGYGGMIGQLPCRIPIEKRFYTHVLQMGRVSDNLELEEIGSPMFCESEDIARATQRTLEHRHQSANAPTPSTQSLIVEIQVPSSGFVEVGRIVALSTEQSGIHVATICGIHLALDWRTEAFLPGCIVIERAEKLRTRDEALKLAKAWNKVRQKEIQQLKAPQSEVWPSPPPGIGCTTETDIRDVKIARSESLEALYPNYFATKKTNATIEALAKAYALDLARRHGVTPEQGNLDTEFFMAVSKQLDAHRHQPEKLKWAERDYLFALFWPKMVFLSLTDGAALFTKLSGFPMDAKGFKNRRDKLKLASRLNPGPPPRS